MEFLIALIINLLVLALIVLFIFWIVGLIASAFEVPPKIVAIIKAIIGLIVLLYLLQILFGTGPAFYPLRLPR